MGIPLAQRFTRRKFWGIVSATTRSFELEVFHVDGVGGVALAGGVGYIEFSQFTQIPQGKGAPKTAPSHRVSMSLDTLLRLHQALSDATRQLEDKGVIKRRDAAPVTT